MCGIVGYIGHRSANEVLISGLRKLEYRGYDSAGVATIPFFDDPSERCLHRVRAKGKLIQLEEKLNADAAPIAPIGIGHTRWATHGKPEEHNAHPHTNTMGNLAVVQNGIVENYHILRTDLKALGHIFVSETDTEVIPHMIAEFLTQLEKQGNIIPEKSPSILFEAVRLTVDRLQGAYAIAVVHADYPDELIVVRQQAPLVIGLGKDENFCASDTPALVAYTRTVIPLDNGEIARLTKDSVQVFNAKGDRLRRSPQILNWNPTMVEKQGFKHYMLKEIYEQPGVFRAGLASYISETNQMQLGLPTDCIDSIERVEILACGTSWHASLVGKYLLEQIAGVPTSVQYASEYRYSPPPVLKNTLVIGVTQSGETADTLAALELAKSRGDRCLGITNRTESSIGRIADAVIDTQAGIEIGVAATKTFVAQLLIFYLLAIEFGMTRGTLSAERTQELIEGLRQLPAYMERILESQERYIEDEDVPVVAIAAPGSVYEKVLSNSQEAKARDAKLIGVAPLDDPAAHEVFDHILPIPVVDEIFSPILTVIPLQLLSYHVAAHRGLDVDQPRNLAKSVTVE